MSRIIFFLAFPMVFLGAGLAQAQTSAGTVPAGQCGVAQAGFLRAVKERADRAIASRTAPSRADGTRPLSAGRRGTPDRGAYFPRLGQGHTVYSSGAVPMVGMVPDDYGLQRYRFQDVEARVQPRARQYIEMDVEIPTEEIPVRLERMVDDALDRGRPVYYRRAGGGLTSEVYFEVPANGSLTDATEVVKIRGVYDGEPGREVEFLRRDMVTYEAARELTARARYGGQPFIEVAEIISPLDEIRRGVMRQRAVHGTPVRDLATAISILDGRTVAGVRMSPERARALVRGSGMPIEELRSRIAALEQFYRDTHDDVIQLQRSSGIMRGYSNLDQAQEAHAGTVPPRTVGPDGGRLSGPDPARAYTPVGFDYNHGSNVIWVPGRDGEVGRFVMIDW